MNILFIEVLIRLTSERAFLYQFDLYKQFFFCCIFWNEILRHFLFTYFFFFQLVTLICFLFYLNKILFLFSPKSSPFCDYNSRESGNESNMGLTCMVFQRCDVGYCMQLPMWMKFIITRDFLHFIFIKKGYIIIWIKLLGKIYCVWKFFIFVYCIIFN